MKKAQKINSRILSIPPYISTAWTNVSSLHVEENGASRALVVFLTNGNTVRLPNLSQELMDLIFEAHANFLDESSQEKVEEKNQAKGFNPFANGEAFMLNMPFKMGDFSLDNLASFMQHNGEQKDMPDLPQEMLSKILEISKMMGMDELKNLPKAEPHCNCTHCQVVRAIAQNEESEDNEIQEEVLDEELSFRNWDIVPKSANLFTVINPLDKTEEYQVYIGDPIGCTCGHKNCEHIEAVLRS